MKTRNGFVSNSSSSNFILAVDEKETEISLLVKIPIKELGDVFRTESALKKRMCEDWGDLKELKDIYPDLFEAYQKALKSIKAGKKIIFGGVTNEGDVDEVGGMQNYLYDNGFSDSLRGRKVKVLHDTI